ncbi:MAG: hypothetical protein N3A61_03220, partial [Ignavibacteria bacterium]|nr:hypothetical protein [Ignavibacteria bacterium]
MGRALLIVLISGIVVFLLTLNTVKKTTASSSDKTNLYYKVSKARAIASSAVEINLNKLKYDKSYRVNLSNSPLLGGYYDIRVFGNDTVKFISKGKYLDTSYTLEVNVKWDSLIIPPVTSGLSVSSENLNLKLSGNIYICGNDINPNGTPGPGPNLAGISVQNINDSIRLADSLSSKVKSNIVGVGSPPSIRVNSDSIAYTNYTSQYIQSADIILQPGTYSSGTVLG